MSHPITKVYGLILFFFSFTAEIAIGSEIEPLVEPYNHILNRSTLNEGHGDEVQVREILFAPDMFAQSRILEFHSYWKQKLGAICRKQEEKLRYQVTI